MTEKEIDELVQQLPYLNKGESYIIHREDGKYRFEYLLPNGELIIASNSIGIDRPFGITQKETSKQVLKDCLKNHKYISKYIGEGVFHKMVGRGQ